MRTLFTPDAIKQIARWVRDGASPAEIAQRIGCTLGTLRVRCSQLGISLKRHNPRADVRRPRLQITLTDRCMDVLQQSALEKGLSSDALAQALLEVITKDHLCEAILDDAPAAEAAQVLAKRRLRRDHTVTWLNVNGRDYPSSLGSAPRGQASKRP